MLTKLRVSIVGRLFLGLFVTVLYYHKSGPKPNRRSILAAGLATSCVPAALAQTTPRLARIVAGTIATSDITAAVAAYQRHFAYRMVEDGVVPATLASSWGTPDMAGRRFAVLQSANAEPYYIRIVQIAPAPDFRPITTLGWNSIELAANDPDAMHENLQASPFRIIGTPAQLAAFPTVRAMQAIGPAGEVVHITSESGPPTFVPRTSALVGRPFILVLAVGDVAAATEWYAARFALAKNAIRSSPIATIATAQGLPPGQKSDATFLALAEPMNFVELWGFAGTAAVPRLRAKGQLPPGVALATFAVDRLDDFNGIDWILPPAPRPGPITGGRRSATFIGPAGELVELVETG